MPRDSSSASAPPRPHLDRSRDEQLDVGIGDNDRADVAAVEHRPASLGREAALPLQQFSRTDG